jgi:tight adherence protein C
MNPILVTVTFACLMAAAAVGLYAAFFGGQRAIQERLADLAVKVRLAQGNVSDYEQDESFGRVLLQWAVRHLPAPKTDTPKGEKVTQLLIQAGYLKAAAPQLFQLIRLGAIVGCALLGLGAALIVGENSSSTLALTAAGGAFGAFIPSYLLAAKARKRQTAIAKELSDVLDLLVVCVEAGLGLYEAIKIVGSEAERHGQVIGRELALVGSDVSSGASLGEALRKLSERTAVEDVKPLAATLIQSEQLGAQIAPALRASSDALRARRRLRAEEAAQKTAVKILFPLVLFVLPAMLIVIVGPALIQILATLGNH